MKTEKESGQRLQRGAIIWFLGVEDIHYSDYKKDDSSFEKPQRGHQKSNKKILERLLLLLNNNNNDNFSSKIT